VKILAIQNRMGIGDTVIFLPFIKSISTKFNSPVNLLVKENSRADQFLNQTNYVDKIIHLKRNNQNTDRHDGAMGFFNLVNDLKNYKYEIVFIFNSSLRFNLIARLAGIKKIYQYPLFQKKNQHITDPAKNLIKESINIDVDENPEIQVDEKSVQQSFLKYNMKNDQFNIMLAIGGSGSTKRIPPKTFLSVMEKISNFKKSHFFLATGKNNEEQVILKEIYNSKFREICTPLDELSISEILPIIKNCDYSICNDTSFSHLSSALGIKTITLMADTPIIYGSYSSIMFPIIPDGETTVTHDTLGKDKINPEKIFNKFLSILN
jgi:heptosyltransferase-2